MIDFHCHITTPGSKLPERQGEHYRTLRPLTESCSWIDVLWAESIETVAENYRNESALRSMRLMSPVIYSEMVRRLLLSDARRLTAPSDSSGDRSCHPDGRGCGGLYVNQGDLAAVRERRSLG